MATTTHQPRRKTGRPPLPPEQRKPSPSRVINSRFMDADLRALEELRRLMTPPNEAPPCNNRLVRAAVHAAVQTRKRELQTT